MITFYWICSFNLFCDAYIFFIPKKNKEFSETRLTTIRVDVIDTVYKKRYLKGFNGYLNTENFCMNLIGWLKS